MHMYAYYAHTIFNHSYPVFYSKISDILSTTFTFITTKTPEVPWPSRPNSAPRGTGESFIWMIPKTVGLSGYTPLHPKVEQLAPEK